MTAMEKPERDKIGLRRQEFRDTVLGCLMFRVKGLGLRVLGTLNPKP